MQTALVFGVLLFVFFVFSYLAVRSLNLLNYKIIKYYDFGKFLPGSNKWSTVVYLIIIAIFLSLVLYLGRGEIAKFLPA